MAKVTIEFDPAIPGDMEAVAQLFYPQYLKQAKLVEQKIAKLDENVPTAAAPEEKGRIKGPEDSVDPIPESKTCEHCWNTFTKPASLQNSLWLKRRFCGKPCAVAHRHRVGHPWTSPKKTATGENKSTSYGTTDWSPTDIPTDRDSHGKTKYCQQCGMFIWRVYENRRSRIDPDKCDSCGKDPVERLEYSETPSIDTSRAAEVSS